MLNGIVVNPFGTKYWYKDDKRHREDGPAIEWADGEKHWFKDGTLHREDGPAVEEADGDIGWYFQGEFLDWDDYGFWKLWDKLTPQQRANPNLLRWMPRYMQ